MSVQIIVIILSVVAYVLVGLWAGKRITGTVDYYVSGRSGSTFIITGTLVASMLSTNGFMGETGWSYGGNFVNEIVINAMTGAGLAIGCFLYGRYLRRAEPLTMPEYFGKRFDSKAVQRVSAIITIISITCYLLAVCTGTGVLLSELTGLNLQVCYIISFVSFISFTFYGGSKGAILTETMMFLVFLAGTAIAAPYLISHGGGLGGLIENLMNNPDAPQGLLDYHGNFAGTGSDGPFGAVMYTVIYGLVWFIVTGVSPWQAGRHMMAKSEHVALRSGIVGCVCATVFLFLLHLVTISLVNVDATMEPERAIVWGFANLAPVLIGSVALAGIVAAGLSSAVTFLSIIGFSITNDLFDFKFKDDKDKLFKSRMIMLGAGVVALILALCNLGGIRVIAWLASTIIASSWCVVSYGGIWSKRLSSRGALWSMIAGFVGFVVTKFLQGFGVTTVFSNFLDPFFIGIYLSILFAVIGSATKAPSPKEIAYREKLLIVPKSELDPREYKITYRYTTMSIIVGVAFTAFLVFYWVLPYNGGHL